MDMNGGISASLGLFILIFPIVGFILIFGELMAMRKRQKKILELLELLAQNRGIDVREQLDDDDI
jgi:hypothetical protein